MHTVKWLSSLLSLNKGSSRATALNYQELPSYIMLIYVDAPYGRKIRFSLKPSNTVSDLKVCIEDEEQIPQGIMIKHD